MPLNKTQTFNDGILSIYSVGEDDELMPIISGIRFGRRTVGSKRFFEAYEYQHRVDEVVRIPYTGAILANDVAVIGEAQYNILQVQKIFDTMPKCLQLTLEELREGREHDYHSTT